MKNSLATLVLALPMFFSAQLSLAAADSLPTLDKTHRAVLVTDPQNDFLREDGKLYGLLKDNLDELGTIDNIEKLMKAAKAQGVALAVDPLVYTQQDSNWSHAGLLQRQLLDMKALHRAALNDTKG